jgi:hypothetical protein
MFRARLAVVVGTIAVTALLATPAVACTTPNWVAPAGDPAAEPPAPGSDFPIDAGGYEEGPVDIRLDGLTGDSLGTADAGEDGRFSTTVELPADLEPGPHQIVATQIAEDGTRLWGFASITVAEPAGGLTPGVLAGWGAGLALLLVGVVLWLRRRLADERVAHHDAVDLVEEPWAPVESSVDAAPPEQVPVP